MNAAARSFEILYCKKCKVGMDATVSKTINCPTCGHKRNLLTAQEWTLLPDNSRGDPAHLQ